MKRYQLFGIDNYYPGGGFNDRIAQFDTLEELHQWWKNHLTKPPHHRHNVYQLADIQTDRFSYWFSYGSPTEPKDEKP